MPLILTDDQYRAEFQALIDAGERELLRAEYVSLIGYDPFEDDPSMTVGEVREIIADYKHNVLNYADDGRRYFGWHSVQSATRDAW